MRIAKVSIHNVLGIDDLKFEGGKFVEITAGNGRGKTSVVEAIKSVFRGGEDATLMRKGAKEAEIVLILDDGTSIKRRMTEKTTTTTVEKNGVKAQRPAETLKALADMFSVNPVSFLTADPKVRVNVLLQSLPIVGDSGRVSEIVGHDWKFDSRHALIQLEELRKAVFDERTGTNRAIREKDATINQLAATLPDNEIEMPTVPADLLSTLSAIDTAKQAELERITTKLADMRKQSEAKKQGIRETRGQAIGALENQMEAIRRQMDEAKATETEALAAETEAFADMERRAGAQREKKLGEFAAKREGAAAQLASIESARTQAAKHAQTRETVQTMREAADAMRADADRQTATLEALDAYKLELLASLPIPGLEVRDGAIYRDDIPFDRLNTAQRTEIAVEIAKLRAGKLAVACVDGLELLDTEHYEAFRAQAIESGLQLFVTRVADGELSISSEG